MASLLQEALPAQTLVVAIDPGKVCNRVLLASGERGLIGESVSLPTLREGLDELVRLIGASGAVGEPVIAIEATGSLHGPWTAELERRFPGRVRVLAPSETQAARAQLGSRRFKSDDRDCAALVWLARQGLGRSPDEPALGALTGAVRHRRQLVSELKVLRQRLHGQLNALCPGLSAPQGQGRTLDLLRPSGRAVLACAAAFAGRAPSVRSLVARAPGRLGRAYAEYWVQRWRACLPPPADAELRAERLRLDLTRLEALVGALATVDAQTAGLLAKTPGQVLTSLPGVAVVRAAPRPPDHRDALMAIAWGLSQASPAFRERADELRARGFQPLQVRVALARHACRLCHALLRNQEPYDETRYRQARRRGR